MPAFQINDEEWSSLVEEPGDLFLAYCAIRRFMDYRTGIAGRARRISEQMLSEVLYVAPTRGRHESGSPSRQKVRSIVDRLVKLGVLVPVGPMVFELPLANRDGLSKSSATDEQPDQQPDQQPTFNCPKTSNGAGFEHYPGASATGSESAEELISNLPPISDLPTATPSREAPHRFGMFDGWLPTPQGWAAATTRNGIRNAALSDDVLMEFRSFWINSPEKPKSQGQWEHQLAQALKRAVRRQQANGGHHATAQTSGNGFAAREGKPTHAFGSLVDELTDTSWADRLSIPID